MPVDFGTGALGTAVEGGLGLRRQGLEAQQQNSQAIQNATGQLQPMAQRAVENQLDMVTITPQMAQGLSKVTGDDSWNQAVGTKWKSNIFAAVTSSQAQMNLHTRLEDMREKYGMDKDKFDQWFKDAMETKKEGAAQKRVDTQQEGANKRTKARAEAATKKGSSTKDLQAQKALLSEAHTKQALLANPFAEDSAKADAQKWLKDNDADLQVALKNMKTSAGVPPAPGGTVPNSTSAATVPLDQKLPGLD